MQAGYMSRRTSADRITDAIDILEDFVCTALTKEKFGEDIVEVVESICGHIDDVKGVALECAAPPEIPGIIRSYNGTIRDTAVSIEMNPDERWRAVFTPIDGSDGVDVVTELESEALWIADEFAKTGEIFVTQTDRVGPDRNADSQIMVHS